MKSANISWACGTQIYETCNLYGWASPEWQAPRNSLFLGHPVFQALSILPRPLPYSLYILQVQNIESERSMDISHRWKEPWSPCLFRVRVTDDWIELVKVSLTIADSIAVFITRKCWRMFDELHVIKFLVYVLFWETEIACTICQFNEVQYILPCILSTPPHHRNLHLCDADSEWTLVLGLLPVSLGGSGSDIERTSGVRRLRKSWFWRWEKAN